MTDASIPLPLHAYVPGVNARPAEGAFDAIRETVAAGMTEAELAATQAFRTGLIYLDSGYFWEAHEVLEPVWMVCPEQSAARQVVQGLIQLANANLKVLMRRPRAVLRLCDIARGHFERAMDLGGEHVMHIGIAERLAQVEALKLEQNVHYSAINMPIIEADV